MKMMMMTTMKVMIDDDDDVDLLSQDERTEFSGVEWEKLFRQS